MPYNATSSRLNWKYVSTRPFSTWKSTIQPLPLRIFCFIVTRLFNVFYLCVLSILITMHIVRIRIIRHGKIKSIGIIIMVFFRNEWCVDKVNRIIFGRKYICRREYSKHISASEGFFEILWPFSHTQAENYANEKDIPPAFARFQRNINESEQKHCNSSLLGTQLTRMSLSLVSNLDRTRWI